MDSTPERDRFPTTWESGGEVKEAPPNDLHCPLIKDEAHLNSTNERCAMRREIGGGCYTNPCGDKKTIRVRPKCTKPGCNNEHVGKGLCRKHYNDSVQCEKNKLYVSRIPLRKLRNRVGDLNAAELNLVAKYVEEQILMRDKVVDKAPPS